MMLDEKEKNKIINLKLPISLDIPAIFIADKQIGEYIKNLENMKI